MFHVSSMCRVVLVLFSCISTFYCTVLTWWLCHLRQNCCVRFGGVGEECCVGKWFILPQNICAWIVVGHRIDMYTYSFFFTNTLIFLRLLLLLVKPADHRDWFVRALLSANEIKTNELMLGEWVSERVVEMYVRKEIRYIAWNSLDRKSNIQHPT